MNFLLLLFFIYFELLVPHYTHTHTQIDQQQQQPQHQRQDHTTGGTWKRKEG